MFGGKKYWYNIRTREVEHGRKSLWSQRMGPYDTAEEAMNALKIAQARNEVWDAEDEAEKERED